MGIMGITIFLKNKIKRLEHNMVLIRLCKMSIENNPIKRDDMVNCRLFECNKFSFQDYHPCEFAVYIEVPISHLRKFSKKYRNRRLISWASNTSKRGSLFFDNLFEKELDIIELDMVQYLFNKGENKKAEEIINKSNKHKEVGA